MDWFKRAYFSVWRNRTKSMILLLVLAIIGSVICGAIAITQGSEKVEQRIRQQTAPILTIRLDEEAIAQQRQIDETFSLSEGISPELIEVVGQSSDVKIFDYSALPLPVRSDQIMPWIDTSIEDTRQTDGLWNFRLYGIHHTPLMLLEVEAASLYAGRSFEKSEIESGSPVTIISKLLAEQNHLNVDDWLLVKSSILDWSEAKQTGTPQIVESIDIPLQIIGIIDYADFPEQIDFLQVIQQMEQTNQLLVPNKLLMGERLRHQKAQVAYDQNNGIDTDQKGFENYESFFWLVQHENIPRFIAETNELLPEYYQVMTNLDSYPTISASIKQVSGLANYVLQLSVGAGILVTGLIAFLFIRDRKYEIAVYLSLGEHRAKIVAQLVVEVMIVSVVALCISLVLGNLFAHVLSDTMVRDYLVADTEHEVLRELLVNRDIFGEYASQLTPAGLAENFRIELSPLALLSMSFTIMGTAIGGTVIPTLYILQFSPRKIMY